MKPADTAVALDDETRGPVVLADDRDFYGQCERVVLAVLGQYDKLRTFFESRHPAALAIDLDQQSGFSRREYAR